IMADLNVPANDALVEQAPAVTPTTRKDDQILSLSKAFMASFTILAIYIQQFWDTMCFNSSTRLYSCQLNEQWFNLHKDILRDALNITPTNDNNHFVAPPSSDTVKLLDMTDQDILKNLATASNGKKKTALLLILNVRFTKLIIHHLRTKHNIHPRTGLPLHYSHDENVLNTLRFVGKDGREIFRMSIPDALLTDEIKVAPYYNDYQEHVSKYQQILDAERGKAEEGGATKSSKATKVTKPKAAKVTKPAGDPAPKKRKLVKETPNDPLPAKRSKVGLVGKRRKAKSPLRLIDEPNDEGVLVEEHAHDDEEADLQRALELSLKEQGKQTQGPARPVVLREPDFEKFHPLPEPTKSFAHVESPFMDAELNLTNIETESDEEASKINARNQEEGQAGPNPGVQDEGQAGPNPGIAAESQLQSSYVENLKLPTEDQEEEPGKTNAKAKVQSMVSVPIHQDTSLVPLMTILVIDLMTMQFDSPLPTSIATTSIVSQAVDEIVTDAVDWAMQAPLRVRFRDLPTIDMKEILQQRMFEDDSYKAHIIHNNMYEALQKSLELDYSNQHLADQEEARKKRQKRRDVPRTPLGSPPLQPPPLPLTACASSALGNKAPSLSKTAASTSQSMAWTTSDTRYESAGVFRTHELSPNDSLMQDDSIPEEQVYLSNDEDSKTDHQSKANSRKDWWKPLPEEERLVTPKPTWTIPSSNKSDVANNWASVLATNPIKNSLLAKTGDMMTFLKWYC
ncbi:retrovirus-related pol polyprotein from transposon TNT 1-94, partial [Tanacetum coccineum]